MVRHIDLKNAKNLQSITEFLAGNGGIQTKTVIRNRLDLSDTDVWPAINYGEEVGCLKAEGQGYYKLKKGFTIAEENFYPAVNDALKNLWANEKWKKDQYYIEETARKDSKIAGRWTRPDLTMISHRKYPWTIGQEFDVVTFEVKRPDTCNVLAVFEALSHRSAATRAYVVFPVNAKEWSKNEPEQEVRVMEECTRHGVGLIFVENIYEDPKPVHVIKAQKHEIDHERCSAFLDAVISKEGLQKISMWK